MPEPEYDIYSLDPESERLRYLEKLQKSHLQSIEKNFLLQRQITRAMDSPNQLLQIAKFTENDPDVDETTKGALQMALRARKVKLEKEVQVAENYLEKVRGDNPAKIEKRFQIFKGNAYEIAPLGNPIVKSHCGVDYTFYFAGSRASCVKCGAILTA